MILKGLLNPFLIISFKPSKNLPKNHHLNLPYVKNYN